MMHDSVYEIAGDDPRKANLVRLSLEKLATGPDERLKEMAQAVLDGEVDLREAAMSTSYGDAIGDAFSEFTAYYHQLDEDERAAVVADAERGLDELLDGPPIVQSPERHS